MTRKKQHLFESSEHCAQLQGSGGPELPSFGRRDLDGDQQESCEHPSPVSGHPTAFSAPGTPPATPSPALALSAAAGLCWCCPRPWLQTCSTNSFTVSRSKEATRDLHQTGVVSPKLYLGSAHCTLQLLGAASTHGFMLKCCNPDPSRILPRASRQSSKPLNAPAGAGTL